MTFRSSPELLERTMRGLVDWQPGDLRLHLHANAADANEADAARGLADRIGLGARTTVTWSAGNLGFAEGQNRCLHALFEAGCDFVVVHNPDLILTPDAAAVLVEEAGRLGAGPALLGPALELADPVTMEGTGLVDSLGIRWTRDGRHLDSQQGELFPPPGGDPVPVAGISGACLLVSHPAYDVIVGASGEFFDADFLAYREDAELAYRAALLGVGSYLCPRARGRHARRLRGTTRGTDALVDRLGVRNRFLIAFKYGRRRPGNLVAALCRDLVVVCAVLLRERSSLEGLAEAWRLRRAMAAKGAQVFAAAAGAGPAIGGPSGLASSAEGEV